MTSEEIEGWDRETGKPRIATLATAVQVWSVLQGPNPSVAEVARTFKLTPKEIIEAAEWHPYMLLIGPDDDYEKLLIEHDGE